MIETRCLKNVVIFIQTISHNVLNKIEDKSNTYNMFRTQSDDSIMFWFYIIAFIGYMIAGKSLVDSTNVFSPNDYHKYFKDKYGKRTLMP